MYFCSRYTVNEGVDAFVCGGNGGRAICPVALVPKKVAIGARVRISLVGIELLAIEARAMVASVETYLKYAEAVGLTAMASPA
ncbi:MAG TPA: gas vesicle protein GvpJ [Ktedonobacteraceae bacterium]|jgi:hypothetical protein